MEDFARAVEDGLKLSKRLVLPGGVPPPRPPAGMERTVSAASASGPDPRLLPTAPMAYALVTDPAAVDTPDVPSYQPYVYGDLDPPALIPLQMKEVDLAVDCALDAAHVTLRARWWLHCITRSRDSDVRLVVPLGEQVSTIGFLRYVIAVWHFTLSPPTPTPHTQSDSVDSFFFVVDLPRKIQFGAGSNDCGCNITKLFDQTDWVRDAHVLI
jgi:hypothetical protein